MGCPICNGTIGYVWGSDLPCMKCKQKYRRASKDLPEDIDILDWGSAWNAKEKALAEGKPESEAEAVFSARIQQCLKAKQRYIAWYRDTFCTGQR